MLVLDTYLSKARQLSVPWPSSLPARISRLLHKTLFMKSCTPLQAGRRHLGQRGKRGPDLLLPGASASASPESRGQAVRTEREVSVPPAPWHTCLPLLAWVLAASNKFRRKELLCCLIGEVRGPKTSRKGCCSRISWAQHKRCAQASLACTPPRRLGTPPHPCPPSCPLSWLLRHGGSC